MWQSLDTAIIFHTRFYRIHPKQFIPGCIAEVGKGKRIIAVAVTLKFFPNIWVIFILFWQANKENQVMRDKMKYFVNVRFLVSRFSI